MMIAVLLLATFLRFFNLGATPGGLYVDEASIGYNAYSIMMTGRDEYGKNFPVLIKSFGDYKASVYTYLLIPVYKVFGMNMVSTRSVSALSGVVTVLFLYLLIKLLTGNKRLAIFSALVLTISPWHILLSRAAVESNLALAFMVVGLWAFFKYTKGAKVFLMPAAVATALSFVSYHSERIILPLLYLGLGWYYRKIIFKKSDLKRSIGGLTAGLIILIPTLLVLNTPAFFVRARQVSVLGASTGGSWVALYAAYFSPKNLFGTENFVPRDVYPDVGPFLIWQLPFLFLGIIKFIRSKTDDWKRLMILLLIISPLPASFVGEPFGMVRALPLVIPLSVVIAIGLDEFLKKWKSHTTLIVVLLVLWSLGRIYLSAFKLNDYYRYQYWDSGVDKVVAEINKLPDKNVQVDGWRAEVYSQLLFFLKYDPAKYQADNGIKNLNDYYNNRAIDQIRRMGRITVKTINWDKDILTDRVLVGSYVVIGDDQIRKYCLTKVFTVRAPDNAILFVGARTNPHKPCP